MGSWRKACDCKRATATQGRMLMHKSSVDDRWIARMHPEPVCDSCDTPWRRAPTVDDSEEATDG